MDISLNLIFLTHILANSVDFFFFFLTYSPTSSFWYYDYSKVSVVQSVQFSCSVVSDSLPHHGLQHAGLPCPSPTPRDCSVSVVQAFYHLAHERSLWFSSIIFYTPNRMISLKISQISYHLFSKIPAIFPSLSKNPKLLPWLHWLETCLIQCITSFPTAPFIPAIWFLRYFSSTSSISCLRGIVSRFLFFGIFFPRFLQFPTLQWSFTLLEKSHIPLSNIESTSLFSSQGYIYLFSQNILPHKIVCMYLFIIH